MGQKMGRNRGSSALVSWEFYQVGGIIERKYQFIIFTPNGV